MSNANHEQDDECYVLNKSDYQKYKNAEEQAQKLKVKVQTLKKENEAHMKFKNVLQQKLKKKNGETLTEKLKAEYLKRVIQMLGECVESDDKVMKQMPLSQSHYSVLKVDDKDENPDDALPENFSKNYVYELIDNQYEAERSLVQKTVEFFHEKKKQIKYLENEIKEKKKLKEQTNTTIQNIRESQDLGQLKEKYIKAQDKYLQVELRYQEQAKKADQFQEKYEKQLRHANELVTQLREMKSKILELESNIQKIGKANDKVAKQQHQKLNVDTKTQLVNMISQYTIELKKSYEELELNKRDIKFLLKSQLEDLEKLIKDNLRE